MEIERESSSSSTVFGFDVAHTARAMFIAIGIGYPFPFSALTQPVDYWTLFQTFDVEFWYAVYMWTNLILLFLIAVFMAVLSQIMICASTGFLGQFFVWWWYPAVTFGV